MWVFTRYGFYSAVCARRGRGEPGQPLDPDRIMVRARDRAHLEALQERFPDRLGGCEIREFPNADYRWRIFADKADWANALAELAAETDYGNFKGEVSRRQGPGSDYERALHEVWAVMHDLQE